MQGQAMTTWRQDLILRPWSLGHGMDWPPLGHGGSPALSRPVVLMLLFLRMAMLIWPRFHCDDWELLVRRHEFVETKLTFSTTWTNTDLVPAPSCVSTMCTAHLWLWDFNVRAEMTGGRLSDRGSSVDVLRHHVLPQHSGWQKENCESLVFAAMCDSGVKIN